jgi:hypothetical protein
MEDNQQHSIVHREPFLSIDKVMLFFYVLIPFLPRFGALDAMGFHWMLFAILNAVVTFYLINKNSLTRLPINFKPFTFYLGWITISIVSIIFAYNKIESIVVLSRMAIVFIAIYNFVCLFKLIPELIKYFLYLLLGSLIVESSYTIWMLFYNWQQYNTIDDIIYFIKFFSGNKNILAASIAIKIPVVFYFLNQTENKKQWIAFLGILFLSFSATIILNARATYISVFLQAIVYIGFEAYQYFNKNNAAIRLKNISLVFATLILSIATWQIVFKQLEQSKKTVSYGDINKRIASIEFTKSGSSSRFEYWLEAIDFIKKNPVIGGGLGNWKIHAINYEQKYRTSFVCSKHVHNDVIETTADSGILAGLVFVLIFASLFYFLIRKTFNLSNQHASQIALMLFLMLMTYFIDCLLNFPSERPVMQFFFATIMVISIITFSIDKIKETSVNGILSFVLLLVICFSIYISVTTYYSMCLQAKVRANTAKRSEIENFPSIPNITEYVMPINGVQANYFYTKRDYKKANFYLNKKGNTNPYYYYTEYVKSRILFAQHDTINAIKYASIAFNNRPADLNMFNNLAFFYQAKKDTANIHTSYTIMNACIKNPRADESFSKYYLKAGGDTNYIKEFLQSKIVSFPSDTLLPKQLKKFK